MKNRLLYAAWGGLYLLCVGLGFVKDPQGAGRILMVLTGVIFFLPGAAILWNGFRNQDRKAILTVRILSMISLSLTLLLLVLNFLSPMWDSLTGRILYNLLIVVSAPMVCCRYWVLSLFLWACMMMASFRKLAK